MAKDEITDRTHVLIDELFVYHPVHGDQPERYAAIRKAIKDAAVVIAESTPPSAEQTLAIRALHLASMQANAAIAVNEKPDEDRVPD